MGAGLKARRKIIPEAPKAPTLETHELRYRYHPDREWAVNRVTLRIEPGQAIGLAGPNGSGKTTLAMLLAGLIMPQGGEVRIDDRSTEDWPPGSISRTVGLAFQNPDEQIFSATVAQELAYGPEQIGLGADMVSELVHRALRQFGLRELENVPPATLGFGLRRKVALASIWAMDTPVLILDEPNWGLDGLDWEQVSGALDAARQAGRTVILITHDMRLMRDQTERLIVLSDGQVVTDDSTALLLSDPGRARRLGLRVPFGFELVERLGREELMGVAGSTDRLCEELAQLLEASR